MKYISYRPDRGVYQVKVKIGSKYVTRTAKTEKEAIKKRSEMLRLAGKPANISMLIDKSYRQKRQEALNVMPLKDAYLYFIENEKKYKVKAGTYRGYISSQFHVMEILGNIKIDEIDVGMWQDVFNYFIKDYGLKTCSVQKIAKKYISMYDYYIDRHIVNDNPCKRVKLNKTFRESPKRRAFTETEQAKFLSAAKNKGEFYYWLFRLYFETGCRRSEIPALRWQNIDFEQTCIYIQNSIGESYDKKEDLTTTKTPNSVRKIPISNVMLSYLKQQHLKLNPAKGDFVFVNPDKRSHTDWISLVAVDKSFRSIADAAGIDRALTLHCIRHTVATRLVLAGVDITTIKQIGGWNSASTILNVYAHGNIDASRKALENAVFGQF